MTAPPTPPTTAPIAAPLPALPVIDPITSPDSAPIPAPLTAPCLALLHPPAHARRVAAVRRDAIALLDPRHRSLVWLIGLSSDPRATGKRQFNSSKR